MLFNDRQSINIKQYEKQTSDKLKRVFYIYRDLLSRFFSL